MAKHEPAASPGCQSQAAAAYQLKRLGVQLSTAPPVPSDALTRLLAQAAQYLHRIEQSPRHKVLKTIQPSFNAYAREELLNHDDEDVKVLLAYCFCEIMRITAPEAPYSGDILRGIHYMIVGTFNGLGDVNGQYFGKRVRILEVTAGCRLIALMLDNGFDDLITDMFRTFLEVVSDKHDKHIVELMLNIMFSTIEESEDIQESLLSALFSALMKTGAAMSARKLACNVLEHTAGKFK